MHHKLSVRLDSLIWENLTRNSSFFANYDDIESRIGQFLCQKNFKGGIRVDFNLTLHNVDELPDATQVILGRVCVKGKDKGLF